MAGPADIRAQAKVVVEGLNSLIGSTLDAGPSFHEIDYREMFDKQPSSNFERAFAVTFENAGTPSSWQPPSFFEHEGDLIVHVGYARRKADGSALDRLTKDVQYLLDRMEKTTNYAASTTGIVVVHSAKLDAMEDLPDGQRRVATCRWRVRYRVTRV